MMHSQRILTIFSKSLLSLSVIYGASLFKVTMIVGSVSAFFSGTAIALPMLGYYVGSMGCGAIIGLRLLMSSVFHGLPSIHFLAYHVPGFFASASLNNGHWLIRCVLPLVCMGMWLAHPVGAASFPYALYWLIPVIIYFSKKTNLFFHALASTFVGHAVGSVIWIYTDPMTPAIWYGLIPAVAIERLLFACGITAMVYIVEASTAVWRARSLSVVKSPIAR